MPRVLMLALVVTSFQLAAGEAGAQAPKAAPPKPQQGDPLQALRAAQGGTARALAPITLTEDTALGMGYATSLHSMRAPAVVNTNFNTVTAAGLAKAAADQRAAAKAAAPKPAAPKEVAKDIAKDAPKDSNDTSWVLETGTTYSIDYIENYHELASRLEVSASGSYGTASARANLVKTVNMSRTNGYVLVRMSVFTSRASLPPSAYRLNDDALARATKQDDFFGGYGDSFVTSILYGGELCALLEYKASSVAESQSTQVEAQGRAGAAKFAANFSLAVSTLTKNTNVTIKYVQTGGLSGDEAKAPGPNQLTAGGLVVLEPKALLERLNKFPAEVHANATRAKALIGELKDYSTVANWPAGVQRPIPGAGNDAMAALSDTTFLLREELDTAKDILQRGALVPPATQNNATWRKQYAEYGLKVLDIYRTAITSNPMAPRNTPLLTLRQYIAERKLGLDTDVTRSNAGALCNVTQMDTARIRDCLFGSAGLLALETWPKLKSKRVVRAYMGEDSLSGAGSYSTEWVGGVRIPCPPKPPPKTYLQDWVNSYCKVSSDGSVLAVYEGNGGGFRGGGCGYAALTIACLTFEKPSREAIAPLPELVATTATVSEIQTKALDNRQTGVHAKVTPACKPSFGRYEVQASIKQGNTTRTVAVPGYWFQATDRTDTLVIMHPLELAARETVSAATVIAGDAYCETPPKPTPEPPKPTT